MSADRASRPICQDTGIVNVFLKIGMDVRFEGFTQPDDAVNEGVRRGYLDPQRAARQVLADPHVRAQEHEGQHAGGGLYRDRCPATR